MTAPARTPLISRSVAIKDETTSKAVRALENHVRDCVTADLVAVTDSRGSGAALTSLLIALARLGLIDDRTIP